MPRQSLLFNSLHTLPGLRLRNISVSQSINAKSRHSSSSRRQNISSAISKPGCQSGKPNLPTQSHRRLEIKQICPLLVLFSIASSSRSSIRCYSARYHGFERCVKAICCIDAMSARRASVEHENKFHHLPLRSRSLLIVGRFAKESMPSLDLNSGVLNPKGFA